MLNYDEPFANDWYQRHNNIRSVNDHDSLLYVLLIRHNHINVCLFFSQEILSASRHFQHTNHAGWFGYEKGARATSRNFQYWVLWTLKASAWRSACLIYIFIKSRHKPAPKNASTSYITEVALTQFCCCMNSLLSLLTGLLQGDEYYFIYIRQSAPFLDGNGRQRRS